MREEKQKIVLGTRGSELARAQTYLVESGIRALRPDLVIETKIIATAGDKKADVRAGWKGLFTAEIERALMAEEVDIAVHSAKDLPSAIHSQSEISAVLKRGSIQDVLISKKPGGFAGLPRGAAVGTSSVRRKHQLRWKRPDLTIPDLRGNVPTRLRRLRESTWDAIVLAAAGLDRLGLPLEQEFPEPLSTEIFLPAGGQGVVAMQTRRDDGGSREITGLVNDLETLLCLSAEREFLRLLNVDCNAPVGVLAEISGDSMKINAQFFTEDSDAPREGSVEGARDQGETLARSLVDQLRK